LVVGVIAIAQGRRRRVLRVSALVSLVVGGTIAEFAATGVEAPPHFVPGRQFMTDGRFGALLMCLIALLVIVGSAGLIGIFRPRIDPISSMAAQPVTAGR
jgi:hypothetical protein